MKTPVPTAATPKEVSEVLEISEVLEVPDVPRPAEVSEASMAPEVAEPPRAEGPPDIAPPEGAFGAAPAGQGPPAPVHGVVGPYELLLELASGGMATVYLARAKDGRALAPLVAIKKPHRHLASDKNYLAMLLDEARLASAIVHDNVVRVRELRFDEGEPSIVMDYVEGASLSELWKELAAAERAFDLKVGLRIVIDALAGMHAAHELRDGAGNPLGLVHRDISPHNVIVGCDGRSRLTDFGIAHAGGRFQATRTDEIKGKLAYLAPERVDKRRICTRQSDVFSMAIVLWECIAGRRLFRGEEAVDTLQEVLHLSIPRLRAIGCDIPAPIDDAITCALSRDLDVRFATALEFSQALEEAAGPDAIAEAVQVARLVEAICGARIADRHEQVRRVLDDDAATEKLFEDAGLPYRRPAPEGTDGSSTSLDALEAMAPAAPTDRYALGSDAKLWKIDSRGSRSPLMLGVAAGLLLGIGGTFALASRGHDTTPAATLTASAAPAAVEPSTDPPWAPIPPLPPPPETLATPSLPASALPPAPLPLPPAPPPQRAARGRTRLPATPVPRATAAPPVPGVVHNGFTKLQ